MQSLLFLKYRENVTSYMQHKRNQCSLFVIEIFSGTITLISSNAHMVDTIKKGKQGFALSWSPIGSIDISDICFLLECEINAQQLWVCVWWPNVTDIKSWWMQSFYDYDHQLNLDFFLPEACAW